MPYYVSEWLCNVKYIQRYNFLETFISSNNKRNFNVLLWQNYNILECEEKINGVWIMVFDWSYWLKCTEFIWVTVIRFTDPGLALPCSGVSCIESCTNVYLQALSHISCLSAPVLKNSRLFRLILESYFMRKQERGEWRKRKNCQCGFFIYKPFKSHKGCINSNQFLQADIWK
jgi:hypothetical protein